MNWRKHGISLALAAIAVALGVWIWIDRGSITDTERAARPNDVFPAFRRDQLSRIEIDVAKEKLVLRRDVDRDADADWRIESPTPGPADPEAVDQLIGALEFATYVRKVAPKAAPTFDAPRAHGSIQMGKLAFRFALGGAAPTPEGASYFKVDGTGVFVVSKELGDQLLRGAAAYKSRTIVPYLSLDLASIEVKSKSGDLVVRRTGELTFALASGLRASRAGLDKLWSALAEMRADTFVDADVKDPAVTITMTPKDGRPRGVLLVGGPCAGHDADVVVVRTEPTRLSACAPRGILDGLSQTAGDLADKRLFFAHEDEVEELSLASASGDAKIEVARKGSGWHARAPFDRDLTGDEVDAANALASAVLRAEATSVAPIAPGEPFTLRAHVRVHGGEMKEDELIDVGEAPNHTWIVHRLSDHARLEVTPEVARRLRPSKSALKGRDVILPPLDPKDVDGLALRCGTSQDLARDPASLKWKLVSPKGYAVDASGALDLVDQVARLRADAWIADADDGSFGFATSGCSVTLTARADGGVRTVKLTLGRDGENGLYAIAVDSRGGTSPVFLEPRIFRDALARILVDRSALGVETGSATSIVLARSGARIELSRAGGVLVGPDAGLPVGVPAITTALDALRADDVVRLGPPAPDEGFAAPSLDVRAELEADGGKRTVHLRFGRDVLRKNQAMVFARVDGVDATFAVARARVDPIRNAL
jgi:hypothetical protein